MEPVEDIVRRFKTGAMSYGSISKEAHETLAIAMNRIGGKSNTGEGGEDPARYVLGGQRRFQEQRHQAGRLGPLRRDQPLPGQRAGTANQDGPGRQAGRRRPVARPQGLSVDRQGPLRHARRRPDFAAAAPRHLFHRRLGRVDSRSEKRQPASARISVKLVAEVGVGTVAAGVAKAHADVVLISGYDGGTGASPLTSIKHAGIPWELGLAETHQTLVLNNLRSRIVVETDGQLKTGRDVVIAALLGAEEFGFATAPLVALGCIMMRVCHLNTCPVGVATQDPELRKKFTGDPAHVVNFMRFIAKEVREIMAQLGFRKLTDMVGRADLLEPKDAIEHWKARGLDFTKILYQPKVPDDVGRYCQIPQDHGLDKALDNTTLLKLCQPALERGEKVRRHPAHPQRQSRRRHHRRQRNHPPLRPGGSARRHDPAPLPRLGRPELRRVPARAA